MALEMIDRRDQALGGQYAHRVLSQITHIAWHYTAVARAQRSFITNHERYWRNTLGWYRGGYHFYIDADGKIYWNYDLTTRSNGVGNNNTYIVNVCVEANSASDYSQAQIDARQELTLWLMDHLDIPANNVQGHKEFPGQSTVCPGYSTSQMNNFRSQLANGEAAKVESTPAPKESTPSVKPTGQRIHLPSGASSWRVYKQGGPYTKGNEIGFMNPVKFGGLSYDIVGNPVSNVYLVNTRDWGTVAIFGAPSTGATISGSGAGSQKPKPAPQTGRTLHLPASADTWRVYNPNGPYTKAHSIHQLTPARYGGLSYEIKGSPAPDVYLIDTGVKGRVAIYAGPGTGASVSGSKETQSTPAPTKKASSGKILYLPASADLWKVYNPNGPYTSGNEIHNLTPSRYGGISYQIKGNPAPHVYLIDTGVKGRVAIYAAPSTGATIK